MTEPDLLEEFKIKKEEWEKLAGLPGGHYKVVGKLKEIVDSRRQLEGYPKQVGFTDDLRRELWIAGEHRLEKEFYFVAYVPDIIVALGANPEDRIFIEYVNTEGVNSINFLRCLRGMRALECVMRVRGLKAKGFVLALRESFARKYSLFPVPGNKSEADNKPESILDIMPLSCLVKRLEGQIPWDFV